jgi:membrane-bound lytic murein transglycosylase MltF
MDYNNRFDSLIKYHVEKLFPGLNWLVIKAQIAIESGFNPLALSSSGAQGLLQLMPGTDRDIDGDIDGFHIDGNLNNGIIYLQKQWHRYAAIPINSDRLKIAFGAYNGGPGYTDKAIQLAKLECPNCKFTWDHIKTFLALDGCKIRGKKPDYKQIWQYVDKIFKKLDSYGINNENIIE